MYALPRGPSKFNTNTRRGPTKKIDGLEGRDPGKPRTPAEGLAMSSSPKPVFNGKRVNSGRSPTANSGTPDEPYSPQHDELVHFLSNAWSTVLQEIDMFERQQRSKGPVRYRDKSVIPQLESFKPFDLEEFWGARTLQKITQSS